MSLPWDVDFDCAHASTKISQGKDSLRLNYGSLTTGFRVSPLASVNLMYNNLLLHVAIIRLAVNFFSPQTPDWRSWSWKPFALTDEKLVLLGKARSYQFSASTSRRSTTLFKLP